MIQSLRFQFSQFPIAKRKLLRPLLQKSWSETYTQELGERVAAMMIETLSSNDIGGLIPNNDESVFVAAQSELIRGCAVSAARHGVTYLWGFYVLSEFRLHGIGRNLLMRSVSAHNLENIVQLTVLKSSIGAVKFYETLGFRTQSEDDFELLRGLQVPSMTMTAKASELV